MGKMKRGIMEFVMFQKKPIVYNFHLSYIHHIRIVTIVGTGREMYGRSEAAHGKEWIEKMCVGGICLGGGSNR